MTVFPWKGGCHSPKLCPNVGGSWHFHVLKEFLSCFQKWLSNRCLGVDCFKVYTVYIVFYPFLIAQLSNIKSIDIVV